MFREQEVQINEKEKLLCLLQRQIDMTHIDATRVSASEKEICTRCIPKTSERSDSYTSCVGSRRQYSVTTSASQKGVCSKHIPCSASYTVVRARQRSESCESENRCQKCTHNKRDMSVCTSGSEMASCSSVPVPPRRLLRKKQPCGVKVYIYIL